MLAGHERRDAAQRGLLSREPSSASFRRRELSAALRVRDRRRQQLGELLEALLRVGGEVLVRIHDRDDTPPIALDHDRRGNAREKIHLPKHVAGRGEGVFVVTPLLPRGSAGAVDLGSRQEVREGPARSDGQRRDALGQPDDEHVGSVGFEPGDPRLGAEEPPDLVGDGREQFVRADSACDQSRDPPQRGLLFCDPRERGA